MLPIDNEEVAELLMDVCDVEERMKHKGVYSRRPDGTVPLGTLSCGELVRLVRGVRLLILQTHPQMTDPDVVEALIRSAAVRGAGGAIS